MATEWLNNYMTQQGCTGGVKAQSVFMGTVIEANQAGVIGNTIAINTDGTSTIIELINNWNASNPSLQVSLISGDGTQVPLAGGVLYFKGGVDGECDDFFNTKEDAEVLKGLFIGRRVHQQHADLHNIKQLKMFDIL